MPGFQKTILKGCVWDVCLVPILSLTNSQVSMEEPSKLSYPVFVQIKKTGSSLGAISCKKVHVSWVMRQLCCAVLSKTTVFTTMWGVWKGVLQTRLLQGNIQHCKLKCMLLKSTWEAGTGFTFLVLPTVMHCGFMGHIAANSYPETSHLEWS